MACLAISAFLFLNSCAGSVVQVTLTDLNPRMAEFQGDSIYDNVTNRVSYSTYGVPKYDKLFKEAALTSATLSQIRFSLERVMGDSLRFPADPRSAKFGVDMVLMAKKQVPELVGRVKTIVTGAMALNPVADFSGPAALKAPGVAVSLKNALTDMSSASQDLVQIGKLLLKTAQTKMAGKPIQAAPQATVVNAAPSDPPLIAEPVKQPVALSVVQAPEQNGGDLSATEPEYGAMTAPQVSPPEEPQEFTPEVPQAAIPQKENENRQLVSVTRWGGLVLAALGAGYGLYSNQQMVTSHSAYSLATTQTEMNDSWSEVDKARSNRTLGYILGGLGCATFSISFAF